MIILKLKEIRENNFDTQLKIADILGVQRGTYASWECNNDLIPTKRLFMFANHYHKSIDYIIELSKFDETIFYNEDINLNIIGKNLQTIRKKLQLTQLKFAESIGINQSTYWAYENGKNLITTSSLISIATKYGYSTDWILGRK